MIPATNTRPTTTAATSALGPQPRVGSSATEATSSSIAAMMPAVTRTFDRPRASRPHSSDVTFANIGAAKIAAKPRLPTSKIVLLTTPTTPPSSIASANGTVPADTSSRR